MQNFVSCMKRLNARTPCVSQFISCYLSISLSIHGKGSEKYIEVKLGGGGGGGSYLAHGLSF